MVILTVPKLQTLCAADEMKDITLRAGEKKVCVCVSSENHTDNPSVTR